MSGNNNTIAANITSLIKEIGHVEGEIPHNKDLYNDLGVQSIHAIAILVGLEEKFGISIEDTKFIEARTLEKLTSLVAELT